MRYRRGDRLALSEEGECILLLRDGRAGLEQRGVDRLFLAWQKDVGGGGLNWKEQWQSGMLEYCEVIAC